VSEVKIKSVRVDKPEEMNMILGQSHFIKTVEDLYEAAANAGGGIRFGLAFCEASGPRLIRCDGNDEKLIELAKKNAENVAAGHCFILFMEDGFPINIMNNIKSVPEVCAIFCATANPVEVIIGETEQGRAVLGVVDGYPPAGTEDEEDVRERKQLLRTIGYKT